MDPLIEPQSDNQADSNPNANKDSHYHQSNCFIVFGQLPGGVKIGKFVKPLVPEIHKEQC